MSLLGRLADALWNPWLLGLFLFTGLVLTVGSGFLPLRRFRLWWRVTAGSLLHTSRASKSGGISSLQALATALASTIGTGSIAGVAMAIYLGGPGAVFWMWASALLGMSTGCVEKLLSVQYQTAVPGGGRQGGYALSAALRHGVARGVFTNEAGLGTSAMAHGAAHADHPARQGMWGIFEVFVSTLLVCTVTALVILVSGVYVPEEALFQLQSGKVPGSSLGVPLTARSFASVLGPAGEWVVALSLILFAFSSILGWSCYGQQGLRYLTGGDRFLPLYRAVFLGWGVCRPLYRLERCMVLP